MTRYTILKRVYAMSSALLIALMAMVCVALPAKATDEGPAVFTLETQSGSKNIADGYAIFSSAYYTGAKVVPEHKVVAWDKNYNQVTLVEGRDYTVAYSNNTKVGTATATVRGIGSYTGTLKEDFPIYERWLGDKEVVAASVPAVSYTGREHRPTPKLRIGKYQLKKGVDFIVDSYYSNVNAGTASIWVQGIGNFNGSKLITFTIKQVPISKATMAIGNQKYTGYPVQPNIDAHFNGVELLKYSDYRVVFTNNRLVGKATALISGSGNFSGTRTLTFKISKLANSITAKPKASTFAVKYAKAKKAAQTVAGSKVYRITGANGKVTYAKSSVTAKGSAAKKSARQFKVNSKTGSIVVPKKAAKGTYTVKVRVTAQGDSTHNKATKTVTFKIKVK